MMGNTLATAPRLFDIETLRDIVIVTPTTNLRELELEKIEAEGGKLLAFLDGVSARNVILDFAQTDYFGSTALGFFVRLWRWARDRKGRLVFCNLSAHQDEILRLTGLAGLWPVFTSRGEAMEATHN